MASRTSFLTISSGITAVAALLFAVAGCGGSGGSASPPTTNPNSLITRQNDGLYSTDAKILASRAATGPLLSVSDAIRFDADLATIRTATPTVQNVHARTDASLMDLLVTVTPGASFRSFWQAGTVAPTGDSGLDAFLTQYAATKVQALDASGTSFFVTFGQTVNPTALATVCKAASSALASVAVNSAIGDGDQITADAVQADGSRPYTFTKGFGDCTAGCIFRHKWQFLVRADGKTATLTQESGTPLP